VTALDDFNAIYKQPEAWHPPLLAPAPQTVSTAPGGGTDVNSGGGGGGSQGPSGPSAADIQAAAIAKANAAAKAQSAKQNAATKALAEGQYGLLAGFGTQRDTKLGNIAAALQKSQDLLLQNYGTAARGLGDNKLDNEKAQGDASYDNVANAVRERSSILDQAASQGAGETDAIRAQLQALRNYSANQGEVNRSYFDTLRNVNSAINSLNSDTATNRNNLFNQAESDKESAWANYYNQTADTWTQIQNIENANTNTDSDTSEAYNKVYGDAAQKAAEATKGSYKKALPTPDLTNWGGKKQAEEGQVTSANRAALVNFGGKQKTPEGATLRKGF
jgi:hypothetical protein